MPGGQGAGHDEAVGREGREGPQAPEEADIRSLAQFPAENPNPVLRAATDGRLLYANPPGRALLRALGRREGGPLPEALLEAVRLVPQQGTIRGFEVKHPDDGVFAFTLSRSAGEGHVNLYGVDITERKLMEEALHEADRRKDEFLGFLAHELRNPLAAIRNSQLVLERAEARSDAARRARAVIGRQVLHLTRLVDDLLDVTRITRGKVQLQRERVDLVRLLRSSLADLRSSEAGGRTLEVHTPAQPVWVDGDQVRLTQVVGNLLQNALKFTAERGLIVVSLDREEHRAVLRVKDDGVGIAPSLLPDVFEPFVQADTTLHRSTGGLGLGLALVKGIVELHGGVVRAESEGLGRGATFTVILPAAGEPATERAESTSPQRSPRRRVLVVEDIEDLADSLCALLELEGHEVHVARDGPSGIEAARQLRPDVVLCDVGLPGLDGYEVARRVRAASAAGSGPMLVALTGYASPQDVERATQAGFHLHLAKPVHVDDLARVLARAPELPPAGP